MHLYSKEGVSQLLTRQLIPAKNTNVKRVPWQSKGKNLSIKENMHSIELLNQF